MRTPRLFALLVGINDYPIEAHRLYGCHNDVAAMQAFLELRTRRDQFDLRLKTLLSKEATRHGIVREWEKHLGQAEEEDVVLFYYSGHGSQEPAGKFFDHIEPDGQNETLVCWDSRIADGMDLADKELATLIQLVSQKNPHIVVLLDCCHSGSGSRAAVLNDSGADYLVRQSPAFETARPLDSYILPRNLATDRSVLSVQGTDALRIPDGRHIALSAAEPFELAKETTLGGQRRGVFSYSLLEMLQSSAADFSYHELMRRARTLVGQRTFEQTPTVHATNPSDLNQAFLGGSTAPVDDAYLLHYDRQMGWLMDAGATHGISRGWGNATTELAVFPTDASLHDLAQSIGQVEVTDVQAGRSIVRPINGAMLDKGNTYRARLLKLPQPPSRIYLFGEAEGLSLLRRALVTHSDTAAYVEEVRSLADSDYKLLALRGQYILSRTSDATGDPGLIRRDGIDYRPLVQQIRGYTTANAEKALDQVAHITRWERTLALRNPASQIRASEYAVELLAAGEDRVIPPGPVGYRFTYGPGDPLPSFRVRVRNNSNRRLFAAMLYLSSEFAVDTGLLAEGGIWLEPGDFAWVADGNAITAEVSSERLAFGQSELNETFKLMLGTERFDPHLLELPALGLPQAGSRSATNPDDLSAAERAMSSRALKFNRRQNGPISDWTATELTVRVRFTGS